MWQFTINDYTTGSLVATLIQEPVGWDAVNLHLKRDDRAHGFFNFEDDTFSNLQYDGNGAAILRNAYYNYGIQPNVQLSVTYNCDGEDNDPNLYLGTFDFTTFKDYTADRCYVECALLGTESYYLLKNRMGQQVDLDSLASYDQLPVTQTIACNAAFEAGTNIPGDQFGQIRVTQLLNGLMPGSKITITGSVSNSGTFTVASSKPDYSTSNPDLASGSSGSNIIASVTFDATNKVIDINQLVNAQVGTQLTLTTASWPSGNTHYPIFDNTGIYNVLSVQQFFNYTRITVSLATLTPFTPASTYNYQNTPYFVSTTQDSVVIAGLLAYTSQPTATIITVAEAITNELAGAVFTGSVSGTTLTVTTLPATGGNLAVGQVLTGGQGVPSGCQITAQVSGTTGGVGVYTINAAPATFTPVTAITITTGISLTGEWLQNNMQPYSALSKIITVPSKMIEATSIWKALIDTEYQLNDPLSPTYSSDTGGLSLVPDWANIQSDIDETSVGTGVPNYLGDNSHPLDQLIYFRQGSLACSGLALFQLQMTGNFAAQGKIYGTDFTVADDFSPHTPGFFRITIAQAAQWDESLIEGSGPNIIYSNLFPITQEGNVGVFNVNLNVQNFSIEPGNYLWMWFFMDVTSSESRDSIFPTMLINADSYCSLTISSQCTDTPCSVYLINEALSRCTESYTNGAIQVYSDYFGRQNAQPVASPADGCGGIACITNGLRIRGCVMPDGSSIPKFFTSLDDMFTALDAIHNIGMAIEPDPNRTGYLRLRVEPYEHWFQNTILLTCQNVMNYTREAVPSLLPSTFKCGYQQFETWNNNGLYDIFGSRTYRTPLNHLVNDLDKTCKWMASDYAIEFTRRQFGVTTSDSRYDSSTFILSLTNKYQGPVEQVHSCFLLSTTGTIFTAGNSVVITGSQNNNGTYTISSVVSSYAGNELAYIFVTGHTFTNEQAAAITVTQGGTTYANVPCYFIGANGAIALDTLDLYGAQNGDTIIIEGVYGNTYTIENIYSPATASQPGNTSPFDFPMMIFPTTALSYYGPVIYEPSAIINDTTNQFYAVEQGNMVNGTNILSPSTVMNYRISPAHCAMRHYRNVITDRQYAEETLIFTGGEGNFYALGQLTDDCTPENGNISEGGNLSLANFTTPADGEPLFYPEQIKFEYPLSWADFLAIQANPYGLIQFQHTNEGLQSGWLVDLQYHPYTGMGEFILYPKINA